MSPDLVALGIALAGYAIVCLAIGAFAARGARSTPEEYWLASRSLGTLVLFLAIFGTNCTSFVLVGVPGQAYHDGVGIFSVNVPIVALGIPLSFWLVGAPARRLALELGALSPAELYAKRLGSRAVGLVLFVAFTACTLPYLVVGVQGAAVCLEVASGGAIPLWAGALGVIGLTALYTSAGGMRATAWTNVFQGAFFLVFVIVACIGIASSLGGPEAATRAVLERDPSLLRIEHGRLFEPRAFASWGLVISLTVICFPHMLVRMFVARDETTLRRVSLVYPLALGALWLPVVLIGVWGAGAVPGLEGRASDTIFARMSQMHLPAWMAPLAPVAVLAAVMSTLDAQLLVLSSMLARDALEPFPALRERASRPAVGAVLGLALGAVVFALSLVWGASLFRTAEIAFSGYVVLFPTLLLGVRWSRFTATGAIASIACGAVVLALGLSGFMPLGGFLPVFWAVLASFAAAVLGTLLSTPAARAGAPRSLGT